ncbi:MAG: ferrochelatase [Pseudomonadota bacterium]
MPRYLASPDFDHRGFPGTAVLLVNLGTPDAPTTSAVRRYLAQFLSDPRVIELPAAVRWLLLNAVVLRIRPRRSAHAYQQVWSEAGSPLLMYSTRQRDAVAARLEADGITWPIRVAMRYGNPSIGQVLDEFRDQGLERLLVVPMYPQYSGSTTGSVMDALGEVLKQWRWVPELRVAGSYYADPAYISALAHTVRANWGGKRPADARLLMSFHGLPERYLRAGDPYFCHCQVTARLLAEQLGLAPDDYGVSFQSRVGRERWLTPYTDETLEEWGRQGLARLDVVCPGFSADCLETLEEICMQGRETFQDAGGGEFHYVPALNDDPAHVDMLTALIRRQTQDWAEPSNAGTPDTERNPRAEASRLALEQPG